MLSEKPEEQRKAYEERVKDALVLIHRNGWVHGDVRHANILVPFSDDFMDIRLIDFDDSGKDGVPEIGETSPV
jgi:serine/threonine protein kinase